MKRILVYSHDTYGLGNIRRMLEIAEHLANARSDVSVLLITGSPMAHAFRIPRGVDYIKLPCVGRSETSKKVVKSLHLDYDEVIRLRADIILKAALGFRPDVIVVDKKPLGIGNELQLALNALRYTSKPPKTVLLLRDILDAPAATIQEWEDGGYHHTIDELYDKLLIVGTEQIFDAVREYRFPSATARKVQYCGYIARPMPSKSPEQVRSEWGVGQDPLVLVTAGGGADGFSLMSNYLQGLAHRPERGFKTLMILGPEMSFDQRSELTRLANSCGDVIVREFSDDMISAMNAADLVVSMGGYNTVCELLTLKKKAIVVPRSLPVQEQCIRAGRMQNIGLFRTVHSCALTPKVLVDAVADELGRANVYNHALHQFKMDGLPRIGQSIAALFGKQKAKQRNLDTQHKVIPMTGLSLVAKHNVIAKGTEIWKRKTFSSQLPMNEVPAVAGTFAG